MFNLSKIYTKRLPDDMIAGANVKQDISFRPALEEELKKELGIDNLDDLPKGFVAGWASTTDIDHGRDLVASGAFNKSIEKKGLVGPKGIKFLIQHQDDKPAGKITKLQQRFGGLWIEALFNLEISYVKDYYEASKMQGGMSFSIGYRLVDGGFEFIDKGDDSYWLLTEVDLHEVSAVTFPMNDDAVMVYIKAGEDDPFNSIADFEKALVASGVAKSRNEANRVTRWVKRLFGTPATPQPPVKVVEDVKALDDMSALLKRLRSSLAQPENNGE